MNCIDAIEGAVKSILTRICYLSGENAVDMSDYVHSIQAVLNATREYVMNNPEITPDPEVLIRILYDHGRNSWIELFGGVSDPNEQNESSHEKKDYLEYCFDYIFTHGTYPL